MKKNLTSIVPFTGSLSITERAQVSNWFEAHIAKDKKVRRHWLGLLPLAHAYTLYIATLIRQKSMANRVDIIDDEKVLQLAWELQTTASPESLWREVDVDKECLDRLEEEMFERSARAGLAGDYQWGLDAGDHQDDWNPYEGTPAEWNHNDRFENDSEREFEVSGELYTVFIILILMMMHYSADPSTLPFPNRHQSPIQRRVQRLDLSENGRKPRSS